MCVEVTRDPAQMLAQLNILGSSWGFMGLETKLAPAGKPRHHLIDPRTGEPAQTAWLSVTVIYPDIIAADVYAKTILIGGRQGCKKTYSNEAGSRVYYCGHAGDIVRLTQVQGVYL